MNLRPGGKQPKMRDGFNSLMSSSQKMCTPNGEPKGLAIVLQERGLWRHGLRLQCRKPGLDILQKSCLDGGTCCARALMAQEPDFKLQKCRIQEEIEAHGHQALFYPKFHCEINPIEYVWGGAKRYARNHCGYSIKALRTTIPLALTSVSPSLILKFWKRTERMIQVYREGFAYGTSEFVNRVKRIYHSHRRVSDAVQD
jgi:hypothetical protein